MHWGTGAVLGALRGVWAAVGLGAAGTCRAHRRAVVDRSDAGERHRRRRTAHDVATQRARGRHPAQGDCSVTTGLIAERMIAPYLQSRRGLTSH
jgi:hypothetical protein